MNRNRSLSVVNRDITSEAVGKVVLGVEAVTAEAAAEEEEEEEEADVGSEKDISEEVDRADAANSEPSDEGG